MWLETGKSPDLQSVGWRPIRVNGMVPVPVWRPENQKKWYFGSSQKVNRLETQEGLRRADVSVWAEGRQKLMSKVIGRQEGLSLTWGKVSLFVLFRPLFDCTRPVHMRKDKMLYQFTDLNVNLIPQHPEQCLAIHLGTPWPSQVDTRN